MADISALKERGATRSSGPPYEGGERQLGYGIRLILYNCFQTVASDGSARSEGAGQHVTQILRMAGLPPTAPILKFHRKGL